MDSVACLQRHLQVSFGRYATASQSKSLLASWIADCSALILFRLRSGISSCGRSRVVLATAKTYQIGTVPRLLTPNISESTRSESRS